MVLDVEKWGLHNCMSRLSQNGTSLYAMARGGDRPCAVRGLPDNGHRHTRNALQGQKARAYHIIRLPLCQNTQLKHN